jgi:hypothetical protein
MQLRDSDLELSTPEQVLKHVHLLYSYYSLCYILFCGNKCSNIAYRFSMT